MHLNTVLQLEKIRFSPSHVALEMGISPQENNIKGLESLVVSLQKALALGSLQTVSLTVMMNPHSLAGSDLLTEDQEIITIKNILSQCRFETRFVNRVMRQIEEGPVQWAKKTTKQLLYYGGTNLLMKERAVLEMVETYKLLKSSSEDDLIITPLDQADFYKGPYPSRIVPGKTRYWRTIPFCTRHLLMDQATFLRFEEAFEFDRRLADRPAQNDSGRASHLQPILRLIPCFAPMPGLATSLTDQEWSPFTQNTYANMTLDHGEFNA